MQRLLRVAATKALEQAVAGDEQPGQYHAGEQGHQQRVLLDEKGANGAVGQCQASIGQGGDQDERAQWVALHTGGNDRGFCQHRYAAQADQRQCAQPVRQLPWLALMQAEATGQQT
ncbi:hypothetical protein FQZ97_1145900 [compost metagenome]